jgi:hypothetical protein
MKDTPETYEAVERWNQGKINIFDEMARLERERDEARGENESLKLQIGLWEDGNLISEETLKEIRLLEEKLNQLKEGAK